MTKAVLTKEMFSLHTITTLKEVAKVGKDVLIKIAGVAENYKKEVIVEDFSSCPSSCPFHALSDEVKRGYCAQHCPVVKKTVKVVYVNEKHRYHLEINEELQEKKLSKLKLLQHLLLHFLADSNGFIMHASASEIASLLHCSVRTVKDNFKSLKSFNLIDYHQINADLFSVYLVDYQNYHKTKEEGGKGYIQMAKEFLFALIELKDVNAIRLCLRQLLKYDDDVVLKGKNHGVYTYEDLKRFMPKNLRYKKAIQKVIEKTKKVFDVMFEGYAAVFKLKEEYNGKIQKSKKEKEFSQQILHFFNENNEVVTNFIVSDLVQLGMQFGIHYVMQALKIYKEKYLSPERNTIVENIGGLVRTIIRENFLKKAVV